MLSLRNLHQPYNEKARKKKELTVNEIAQIYTLNGLKCGMTSKLWDGFLAHMENQERMFLKRFGNGHTTLKSCLSKAANLMSYSNFNKRYHTSLLPPLTLPKTPPKPKTHNTSKKKDDPPLSCSSKATLNKLVSDFAPSVLKPKKELRCFFCNKAWRSPKLLEVHQEKCQRRAMKFKKNAVLKKVRSIIVKSRLVKPKKPKAPPKILPFKCTKCSDRFVSNQTLEMHMKFDHRPRPTCSHCQKVFECKRKLLEHENQCNEEDKLFIKQSLGVVDILCPNKVLTCNKCENYFTSADLLREHKHMVNKRNPLPLVIINENEEERTEKITFKVCVKNVPEVVINRVKLPPGDNNCVHCGKLFQSEVRLHQHGMFCHVKNGSRKKMASKSPPKTDTVCSQCNVDFVTSRKLIKHTLFFHRVKNKSRSKEIFCKTCKKTFLSQNNYQKHFKQHGSPNICPLCNRFKHFETAEFLRWHISLVHRKKYCFICRKTYLPQSVHKCLTRLVKNRKAKNIVKEDLPDPTLEYVGVPDDLKSGLTPYRDGSFDCTQCSNSFTREIYLLEHLVTHTDLSPYKCEYCPKTFSDLTCFTSHLRTTHRPLDDSSPYSLCSLKSHLRKELNVVNCQLCDQLLMGGDALETHRKEQHFDSLVSDQILFSFAKRKRTTEYVVDVTSEIELTGVKVEEEDDVAIRSSGPPLEKLLPIVGFAPKDCALLPQQIPEDDKLPEDEIISEEEIAQSFLLPLSIESEPVDKSFQATKENTEAKVVLNGNVEPVDDKTGILDRLKVLRKTRSKSLNSLSVKKEVISVLDSDDTDRNCSSNNSEVDGQENQSTRGEGCSLPAGAGNLSSGAGSLPKRRRGRLSLHSGASNGSPKKRVKKSHHGNDDKEYSPNNVKNSTDFIASTGSEYRLRRRKKSSDVITLSSDTEDDQLVTFVNPSELNNSEKTLATEKTVSRLRKGSLTDKLEKLKAKQLLVVDSPTRRQSASPRKNVGILSPSRNGVISSSSSEKKKLGRPRKSDVMSPGMSTGGESDASTAKKKRGRPRKSIDIDGASPKKKKKERKRFFNLYPTEIEQLPSMVDVNRRTHEPTSPSYFPGSHLSNGIVNGLFYPDPLSVNRFDADHLHRGSKKRKSIPKLSSVKFSHPNVKLDEKSPVDCTNNFAPIRKVDAFQLSSHAQHKRLEKRVAALRQRRSPDNQLPSGGGLIERPHVVSYTLLDQITSPTAPPSCDQCAITFLDHQMLQRHMECHSLISNSGASTTTKDASPTQNHKPKAPCILQESGVVLSTNKMTHPKTKPQFIDLSRELFESRVNEERRKRKSLSNDHPDSRTSTTDDERRKSNSTPTTTRKTTNESPPSTNKRKQSKPKPLMKTFKTPPPPPTEVENMNFEWREGEEINPSNQSIHEHSQFSNSNSPLDSNLTDPSKNSPSTSDPSKPSAEQFTSSKPYSIEMPLNHKQQPTLECMNYGKNNREINNNMNRKTDNRQRSTLKESNRSNSKGGLKIPPFHRPLPPPPAPPQMPPFHLRAPVPNQFVAPPLTHDGIRFPPAMFPPLPMTVFYPPKYDERNAFDAWE